MRFKLLLPALLTVAACSGLPFAGMFGGRWTLKMHSPDGTSPGIVGHIALDKFRMQSVLREVARAEGTREKPAAVLESLQFDDVHTGKFGLNDTHLPR